MRHVRYGEKAAKGGGKGVKASAEVVGMGRLYRHLFVVGGGRRQCSLVGVELMDV